MVDGTLDGHPLKVINLTSGQDGGQNLMLLSRGQDEDDMCGRLLQSLEERVEGCLRQHVYLVDDEHLVFSHLRGDARLLHECLYLLHSIVAGSIKLKYVVRALLVESLAALTLAAGIAVGSRVHAVYNFCEDAGTGGLAHSSWSAKQICVRQLTTSHGILQRCRKRLLTHYRVEGHWPVLTRGDYIVIHYQDDVLVALSPSRKWR